MNIQLLSPVRKIWKNWSAQVPAGVATVAIASLAVTAVVLLVRQLGMLQSLELKAYDRMVRLRPDEGIDARLLVVAITEADLRSLGRIRPSDRVVAQVLANLERHQPRVIGLDLYREIPQEPGNAELLQQLRSPSIIAITNLGFTPIDQIPPPPGIPPEQVGFNDLPIDPDGVIRRGLLFATTAEGKGYTSFALRLAWHYLAKQGIQAQPGPDNPNDMKLGDAVFVPLTATSGAYQFNDDRGYQMLLDYRSRTIAQVVTLEDVLKDRVQPEWIRDKIVLIGSTAPSLKDLFYTPYSASEQTSHQMSGVEVHGQIVSQIVSAALDGRSLFQFWGEGQEWLWIWVWAVGGGTVAWRVHRPLTLGLSSLLLIISLLGTGYGLFLQRTWVPIIAPAIASVAALGTVVTYRAQQAQRQQQMVMTLLGQNTSPEIAAALWKSRDRLIQSGKLPGQRLIATMLFMDIRGFSTISERMPPEALLEWLNEYLEAMTQEVQQYHGIINKFTGDGLLAVFGVPMPRLDRREVALDAYRAIACALAMGDRLEALNEVWKLRDLPPIEMRVGIFTGPIVAGSLGGRDRLEYGVIGDSVNTASRLESCAKDRHPSLCRILIAQDTLVYVEDHFEVEPWGPMALKGKQQLVDVYRVLGHRLHSYPALDLHP